MRSRLERSWLPTLPQLLLPLLVLGGSVDAANDGINFLGCIGAAAADRPVPAPPASSIGFTTMAKITTVAACQMACGTIADSQGIFIIMVAHDNAPLTDGLVDCLCVNNPASGLHWLANMLLPEMIVDKKQGGCQQLMCGDKHSCGGYDPALGPRYAAFDLTTGNNQSQNTGLLAAGDIFGASVPITVPNTVIRNVSSMPPVINPSSPQAGGNAQTTPTGTMGVSPGSLSNATAADGSQQSQQQPSSTNTVIIATAVAITVILAAVIGVAIFMSRRQLQGRLWRPSEDEERSVFKSSRPSDNYQVRRQKEKPMEITIEATTMGWASTTLQREATRDSGYGLAAPSRAIRS